MFKTLGDTVNREDGFPFFGQEESIGEMLSLMWTNTAGQAIENATKSITNAINVQPVGATNNFDSLITINVDGDLDQSVIPQIQTIADNLTKNRDFMNDV